STALDAQTERGQIAPRDPFAAYAFGLGGGSHRNVELCFAVQGEMVKHGLRLPEDEELWIRPYSVVRALARGQVGRREAHVHQAFGLSIWQRPNNERVDSAEDRGRRAEA